MSATELFDWLGDRITQRTQLSRTESRGMLRVVLRECGLQAESLTPAQVKVVVASALGPALQRVKVAAPDQVCSALLADLAGATFHTPGVEDAADVFGRLGRR